MLFAIPAILLVASVKAQAHPKFTLTMGPITTKVYERSEYAPLEWRVDRDIGASPYSGVLSLIYENSKRVQSYGAMLMKEMRYVPQLADVDVYLGCNKCRFEIEVFYSAENDSSKQLSVGKMRSELFSVSPSVKLNPLFDSVDLLPPYYNYKHGDYFSFKFSVQPRNFDLSSDRFQAEIYLINNGVKTLYSYAQMAALSGFAQTANIDAVQGCNDCSHEIEIYERNETAKRLHQILSTNKFHVQSLPPIFNLAPSPAPGRFFNSSTGAIPIQWFESPTAYPLVADWFKASVYLIDRDTAQTSLAISEVSLNESNKKVNVPIPADFSKEGCRDCLIEISIKYSRPPYGKETPITKLSSNSFMIESKYSLVGKQMNGANLYITFNSTGGVNQSMDRQRARLVTFRKGIFYAGRNGFINFRQSGDNLVAFIANTRNIGRSTRRFSVNPSGYVTFINQNGFCLGFRNSVLQIARCTRSLVPIFLEVL